ncbi:50S ribosomal protein L18Ae [Methanobrevibacter curvatus]|jgi:large subunit ribosomal protein LX|uniref:Large ribosomal subunit protein eL20 n=1 Tax=Methanobrevibacter curvatus TaxID=49547 RepID=A0A166B6E5_9EURY|nr:50S ribosomal protein L18Ae [Methanobrevibacter curvatus]KZX12926.1 50S ribosomal protein LX [Methanobrevibacter curvatus]MDR3063711.1 50S ribosomal protein L18a [Methanobrevibacter sp.]
MKTKIYRIEGRFTMGDETKKFIKELKATKEEDIYEKIYSEFGSKHRINKNQIGIEKIDEISADEVTDPIIKAII